MNPYFSTFFVLLGTIIGYLAKPFQDWFLYKLNRNESSHNGKEKIIEELFMLLPAISEKITAISSVQVAKLLGTNIVNTTNNSAHCLTSIMRIKYLLKIELLISNDNKIWNQFGDYEFNCDAVN